jgi:thioredoxin-related protein
MKIHKWQKLVGLSVIAMVAMYILFLPLGVNLNFDEPINTFEGTPLITPTTTPSTTTATATPTPTTAPKSYILYFFEQEDCPYCADMHPKVVDWAKTHTNTALSIQQTGCDLANHYTVRTAPTTILIDKATNKEVDRWVGIFDVNELSKTAV